MKVLWIGPWAADGLSTQVRGSMARALHDAGSEIGAVVLGSPGSWVTGGYDWIRYCPKPASAAGKCLNQARIGRIIAGFDGDFLVLGEKAAHLAPVAAAVRLCLGRKWKIVVDVRTLPIPSGEENVAEARRWRFWKQLGLGLSSADAWMAITSRLRDAVEKRLGKRDLPCGIWESAVDRRFLEEDSGPAPSFIAGCGHEVNVLYLGSMHKGRRLDLPISAMREFDNPGNKVGLHIVGSGNHAEELRGLPARLGIAETVHVWDPVPYSQTHSVIAACDLGILPLPDCDAWNVSSALKLYEYMGAGRPLLVSDIPAHRDAVGGQPFAFFMSEYSTGGFVEALERFLACPLEERRRLGNEAREFVRARHTWDRRAATILGFFATLRGDGRTR